MATTASARMTMERRSRRQISSEGASDRSILSTPRGESPRRTGVTTSYTRPTPGSSTILPSGSRLALTCVAKSSASRWPTLPRSVWAVMVSSRSRRATDTIPGWRPSSSIWRSTPISFLKLRT